MSGDPYQRTQEALDADPSCVMAHCLKGLLTALGHTNPAVVAACLEAAERESVKANISVGGSTEGAIEERVGERERVFLATLRAWSGGRWREVCLLRVRGTLAGSIFG